MRSSVIFLLVVALFTHLGCGHLVTGSGKAVDVTRSVPDFTAIQIGDDIQADVTVGPALSVALHTDDNVAPLVETSVASGVLVVQLPSSTNVSSDIGIHVTITVPTLTSVAASGASQARISGNAAGPRALSASGSSDVTATGIAVPALTVSASGSSTVAASGAAADLDLNASGASKLALDSVVADRAQLDVSGASTASVRVAITLRGQVSGSSHVHEHGSASTAGLELSGSSTVDYAP
jgi:hypothetical protein